MDLPPSPMDIDLTPTFGAVFIGALGMMALYGLTSLQTFIYFTFYPDDRPSLKCLVSLIWILDSFHICLVCHALYHYLIKNYANPAVLNTGIWSLWTSIIVNLIIGCIVQGFFTGRLYVVTSRPVRRWLIPSITILILFHLAFGLESAIWGYVLQTFDRFKTKLWSSALPFAIFAVVSDVAIAISLCITLWQTKSYFMTTNSVINSLMIFAINRCLLTSGIAVVEIVLFAVFPDALWYVGVDFVVGKLYANSLLATLNTRYSVRGRAAAEGTAPASSTSGAPSPAALRAPGLVFSTVVPVDGSVHDGSVEQKV
ncbi:hypothetical protein PsYK624_048390 [Phanerochaete sordida]|uniref:DUF6534 domain-containing protein n=1 Tax=Phanerochaete sordida TaxID=48140 RepID=A0A9P3G5S7_9APHY|nr:hypothetical protein PsYK624_048390 [Phanerochaete sordida]